MKGDSEMNWENLAEFEFNDAIERSRGVCLIPLGCMEKHGQHLPVGTDSIKVQHVLNEAAKIEDVMIFPVTMWLGDVCSYHAVQGEKLEERRMRGGIGISPELLYNALTELCDEIYRNGFDKIVLVNSHGGNLPFLDFFARTIRQKMKPYVVMWISGSAGKTGEICAQLTERREEFGLTDSDMETVERLRINGTGGGHADFREVAQVMSFNPALVHEDKYDAESGASTHLMDKYDQLGIHTGFGWGVNYPNMFNGFPSFGCTKRIGDAIVRLTAERVASVVKVIKEDGEILDRYKRSVKE